MESPLEPRPIYIIGLSSTHSTCMDIVHWKVKCEKHENLVKNICVICQQICARPACNPITFPFLKRTILKYGSLCESRVRWNFQGGFLPGVSSSVCSFSPFPIPGGMLVYQTIRLRREEDLFVLRAKAQQNITTLTLSLKNVSLCCTS